MNDRQLGHLFFDALSSQAQTSPAILIAILNDLLGADVSLLAPLKDLVSRPGFQALMAMGGANSNTRFQGDALLQALAETYQPQVVQRLGEFLEGFLQQSRTAEIHRLVVSPDTPATMHPPLSSMSVPETVILEEGFARSEPSQPQGIPTGLDDRVVGTTPEPSVGLGRREIAVLAIGVTLIGLAGVGVLQGNLLCAPLNVCSAASIKAATMALEKAEKAATELGKANNISAFNRSLREMERQLDNIESEAGLTDQQRNLRARLQTKGGQARTRQKKENSHLLTVQRVKKESQTISKLAPPAAEERRLALRRRLESVPAQSFAFPEAKGLRQQLQPPPPPPARSAAVRVSPPHASTWEPSAAPPARSWRPAPEPYSPPPVSSGGGGAPLREEPLW